MSIRNCEQCHKLFDSVGARRCPTCLEAEEVDWLKVREFVKANPGASVEVVTAATGVPDDRIRAFMRSGLLQGTSSSGMGYPCRKCQKPISTGEYCPICLSQLSTGLTDRTPKAKEEPTEEPNRVYSFVQHYRSNRRF